MPIDSVRCLRIASSSTPVRPRDARSSPRPRRLVLATQLAPLPIAQLLFATLLAALLTASVGPRTAVAAPQDDGSKPEKVKTGEPTATAKPAATTGDGWRAEGLHGAVVAGGPERSATEAGLEVLKEGGNAVDAAAATLLVLCVIDPNNFCFGGEVPIIVYDAQRKVVEVICGQGGAPRLATIERFQKNGIPPNGPEPAAIPGAFDGILTALERSGTITLARAAKPMLAVLDARSQPKAGANPPTITGAEKDSQPAPKSNATPPAWYGQLAQTMRELIAAEATATDRRQGLRRAADYFYRGPIAKRIDAWSKANGGLLRYADLATHVTRVDEPVTAEYRGYTLVKCGAWSQGPMLLQTMQMLEGFDLKSLGPDSGDYVHLTTEALKLALADRDTYLADPLYVDVPLAELLSPSYALTRRALIDRSKASLVLRPGDPRGGKALVESPPAGPTGGGPQRDTTTCLVADRMGNVVAATPSGWGGVFAGDTGIQLGTRLRSLNSWPGHPNCIEPGKRPRITLTPTLVLRDGRPVLAVSVAGGDLQDQVSLQLLIDSLDFGMSPAEAVVRPRFSTSHHIGSFSQTPPQLGSLAINEAIGPATLERLKALGHNITLAKPPIGHPCVLRIDPVTGKKEAAGDPLARRQAAAY